MDARQFFGKEKIGKVLLKLAPPVMLAQLIQALYNIVDSLFAVRAYLVLAYIPSHRNGGHDSRVHILQKVHGFGARRETQGGGVKI